MSQGGYGGGVYNAENAYFRMDGGVLYNNHAGGVNVSEGGGLLNYGLATLDDGAQVSQNYANLGAGMYIGNGSTTNLNSITIQNNVLIGTGAHGRGIYWQYGAILNQTNVYNPDGVEQGS